ncbi:acid-sensing ion channel 1B-like [Diadema antillarum]|uniref:acid-sensing ion channel 1B-like n=1 Tax=Diadema antillarum TaxID=105358 RepID=UPI003A852C93
MPVRRVDVASVSLESKQQEIGRDETTLSSPAYTKFQSTVSWFAIFYKAIPEAVGIAGLKYAFNPAERQTRRYVLAAFMSMSIETNTWIRVLAMGVTGHQLIDRSIYFASNPKSVDISVDYDKEKDFPSVAICNYNSFRADLVSGTKFGDFLSEIFLYPENINMTEYQPALEAIHNMTGVFVNMSHTLESTLILGSWGQEPLTAANFTLKVTDWGVCFVLNDETNGLPKLTLRSAGRRHTLRLTLDARQFDYFFENKVRGSAGFQVVLYDYGTEPNIEDSGFGIAPGQMTLATVDVTEYTSLQPPHGQCGEKVLKYHNHYGYNECYFECSEDYISQACGCKTLIMKGPGRECTAWEFFNCILFAASDVGGSVGLWLGGSILTLFEIVDVIGHSAYVYSRTQPQPKNKTPVHQ